MMQLHPDFTYQFSDQEINEFLKNLPEDGVPYTRHFTQEEDFFVRLDQSVTIPKFNIHHDVKKIAPQSDYLSRIRLLIKSLATLLPRAFSHLTWFFDPRDIFHPGFIQILNFREKRYLYLLRMDLSLRPRGCEVLEAGTNDVTALYRTNQIFFESEILPLVEVRQLPGGERQFFVEKLFEQTWKGESGRGYFVTGQWIDGEISKFISKLFLVKGQRHYPYFPLRCRYNSVSSTVIHLSPEGRKQSLLTVEAALDFLRSQAKDIQTSLKEKPFSEDQDFFQKLKTLAPKDVQKRIGDFRVDAYLNEADHKEYAFYGQMD